jgi:hypothetical protein
MKHKTKSASPGELAYSRDNPPRLVSTPENKSTEGVYLTIARNTQPGACIGCGAPHLSDHPTQEAKPKRNDHGRTVPIPVPPSTLRRYFATSLRRCSAVRSSFQKHTEHTENTRQTHSKHTQKHSRNTRIPSENTRKHTKHTPFFWGGPPIDSPSAYLPQSDLRTCSISSPMGRAARTEDQDEGARSFDPHHTLDFPTQNAFLKLNLAAIFSLQPFALSLSPHSRSACSAYPYETCNRVAVRKDSAFRSKPLVVRFAETALRFAETDFASTSHLHQFCREKCPGIKKAETAETHHNC